MPGIAKISLLLFMHILFAATVQCAKGDGTQRPPNEPKQPIDSNFQSIGLEMILFPSAIHTDGNCQQVCDKWFKILEDFITKPQRGLSMAKLPRVLSQDGRVLPMRSYKTANPADKAFTIDPCLYYPRYCTLNADVWLVPSKPDHFADGIDPDVDSALRAARDIAGKTLRESLPVTSQTLSTMDASARLDYWLGQCCMCQRFVIFPTVYKENFETSFPEPVGMKKRVSRNFPPDGCHPNVICTRVTNLLFNMSQRSNQWFCNMGFVVYGTEGQGIQMASDYAGHCACELHPNRRPFDVKTACFSPEDIIRGIVDAQTRPVSFLQLQVQSQSLRTVVVIPEEDNPLARLEQIQNEVALLDDLLVSGSLEPPDDSPAGVIPDFPHQHFHPVVSSIAHRAPPNTLDELAGAGTARTHRQIGQFDFLASQNHYQNPHQPQNELFRLTQFTNHELATGSSIDPEGPFSRQWNIDSLFTEIPGAQQVYQGSSSKNEASTSRTIAIPPQDDRRDRERKRKASDLEPMDRIIRVSESRSAFVDLTAADDALPRHNRDEGTLESMFRSDQGTTLHVGHPEPVQRPLTRIGPRTTDPSDELDTTAELSGDLSDLFSPMM